MAYLTGRGVHIQLETPAIEYSDWELRQTLFWCQVLHSVLSFPFLLFTLPLFHLCFSRAPASGYTKQGVCVPLQKTRAPVQQEQQEEEMGTSELTQLLNAEPEPELEPELEPEPEHQTYAASALPTVPASALPTVPASVLPSIPTNVSTRI
jgi:hypothetical protein